MKSFGIFEKFDIKDNYFSSKYYIRTLNYSTCSPSKDLYEIIKGISYKWFKDIAKTNILLYKVLKNYVPMLMHVNNYMFR